MVSRCSLMDSIMIVYLKELMESRVKLLEPI